ncbi:hypothetical protein [Erysipelothrix piscisicarius]|uniref:hypothetical protein n=1 Tax=Erysipelothrix piscisicarius TaxID=2485784 RepID=UPI002F959EE5
MFNNNEQTWKDLKAFDTANEIHQQPQTWDKTYHIILERRQEIQNFINLGFRHGPKSIVNGTTLTVVYMKEDPYTRQYQVDIIKEMSPQRNGNQIMVVDTMNDDTIRELVDVYVSINYNEDTNKDLVGLNMVMYAQVLSLYKSLDLDKSPDNPWPSGLVNRVVQGVIIYPYSYEEEK